MTGHLLGGAGGIESVFTVLAVHQQKSPPTINIFNQDPECDLDYCANTARDMKIDVAVKNNFGFGGTNGTLVFKRVLHTLAFAFHAQRPIGELSGGAFAFRGGASAGCSGCSARPASRSWSVQVRAPGLATGRMLALLVLAAGLCAAWNWCDARPGRSELGRRKLELAAVGRRRCTGAAQVSLDLQHCCCCAGPADAGAALALAGARRPRRALGGPAPCGIFARQTRRRCPAGPRAAAAKP